MKVFLLAVALFSIASSAFAADCVCKDKVQLKPTNRVSQKNASQKELSILTTRYLAAVKKNQKRMNQKNKTPRNDIAWEDIKYPGICYTEKLVKVPCN